MNNMFQKSGNIWDKAILGIIILFTILYVTLIWNINITTDEVFTLLLFRENLSGIVAGTTADVHPPLYYFYGHIFELLSPHNIHIQKAVTIIPMTGALVYIGYVARKWIGNKAAFFTLLFLPVFRVQWSMLFRSECIQWVCFS